ncbi:hypothetical protein HPB50_008565 [Hyalomma asiaticum]|uniref:Uncharacterized protein n=1 Tax=Hyalomma asiaticum TaxID=266040 RepID=A0ACB7RV62_HYAAI|nr:hypothetical protein HPB50_008565 [Hyalomma asiaticum]
MSPTPTTVQKKTKQNNTSQIREIGLTQGTGKLKWAELQDQVIEQKIDICALTETYLHGDEQPHLPSGLSWFGKKEN